MMTADAAGRASAQPTGLERPEKADGRVWADLASPECSRRKRPLARPFADGETRTRTGDTTIFSRVLYQLSYLAGDAARPEGSGARAQPPAHACSWGRGSIG